ncbi:MAG: archaeosortase/exosortase family protein [Bacteroidota bacterium]|nr:archaeosortase/exosortase family protein [Bacteroidota bacterium]
MNQIQIDKSLVWFLAKAIGLYLLWFLVYDLWIAPLGIIDTWLNQSVANGGYFLLQKFGFEVCKDGTSVCINNASTVVIGRGCNGLEIYAIFAGFVVLYRGSWLHKIWFIVAGIAFIYLCNILRVAMLAIDHYNNLKLFQFNHKYTYVFIIYFIVFGLWILWINRFSKTSEVH